MDISSTDFINLYVEKSSAEIGELTKQKLVHLVQIEVLSRELAQAKAELHEAQEALADAKAVALAETALAETQKGPPEK